MNVVIKKSIKMIVPSSLWNKAKKYRRRYQYAILYKNNKQQIKEILNTLEDDYSKKTLFAYMKLCTKGSATALLQLTKNSKDQYFDETIVSFPGGGQDEVFVDMGVFDGATSLEFAKRTNYNYKGILLFEPDAKSFIVSKKNIATLKNVMIWNEACYDQDTMINFNNSGKSNAQITKEEKDVQIQAVKLDTKLKTVPYKPTFIKMDVEGAEAVALKGASDTIKQLKPKLAVCIYHKPQDIWELPMLIKEILPEYKLYIRHYDIRRWETDIDALSWELVCYAVV